MTTRTSRAPLVSVITPTYNRSDYLAETLDSILGQDHPSVELIVVDDGSTDDTQAMLEPYRGRISVISQPNSGQATAVNEGLRAATGQYVTLVSDDDPVLPGALSRLVLELEQRPDVLVAFPDFSIITSDGEVEGVITNLDYSYADMIRFHMCMPGPCALFRRSVLDLVQGWDPRWRWVADYDFWLRIGLHGPMVRVPEVLATWRRHDVGATASVPRLAMAREQVDVTLSYFERTDLPDDIRMLETEAVASAYTVGGLMALQGLEPPNVPRFEIEDRWARHVDRPVPPLRQRDGTSLDRIASTVRGLKLDIERLQSDKATLQRHIEALERHLAIGAPNE